MKRNGTVIGGITYRAFPQQGLGEIAFCAIASTEQVWGVGGGVLKWFRGWLSFDNQIWAPW